MVFLTYLYLDLIGVFTYPGENITICSLKRIYSNLLHNRRGK